MIDENGKTVQLWHAWLTGAPMRLLCSVPSVPPTHTSHPSTPSSYLMPNSSARSLRPVVGSGRSAVASSCTSDEPPRREVFDLLRGKVDLRTWRRGWSREEHVGVFFARIVGHSGVIETRQVTREMLSYMNCWCRAERLGRLYNNLNNIRIPAVK